VSTSDSDGQVRPFAAVLQEIGGGILAARLAGQLTELTAAVEATGKKGSITLTVEVAPLKKATANTLTVSAKSTAKIPEPEDASPTTVFFAGKGGVLTREDPNQPQLPLRSVSGKAATA
jgi:glycine cleavage system regulatory protein